jgi:hypothetical protein
MNTNQPENNPAKIGDEPELAIPNGGAAAAILSSGIGCFFVGLFGLLGDAFPALAHFFNFYAPTGPLSGVTTTAIVIWLILWCILSRSWKGKALSMGKINTIAFLLLGMGFLLSFPPFGDLLQGK